MIAKEKESYNKEAKGERMSRYKETVKTIVITVLITGILAFIAGVKYQQGEFHNYKADLQTQINSLKQ